eukprot:1158537-Pelagomonas_calceolata.AAC.6
MGINIFGGGVQDLGATGSHSSSNAEGSSPAAAAAGERNGYVDGGNHRESERSLADEESENNFLSSSSSSSSSTSTSDVDTWAADLSSSAAAFSSTAALSEHEDEHEGGHAATTSCGYQAEELAQLLYALVRMHVRPPGWWLGQVLQAFQHTPGMMHALSRCVGVRWGCQGHTLLELWANESSMLAQRDVEVLANKLAAFIAWYVAPQVPLRKLSCRTGFAAAKQHDRTKREISGRKKGGAGASASYKWPRHRLSDAHLCVLVLHYLLEPCDPPRACTGFASSGNLSHVFHMFPAKKRTFTAYIWSWPALGMLCIAHGMRLILHCCNGSPVVATGSGAVTAATAACPRTPFPEILFMLGEIVPL